MTETSASTTFAAPRPCARYPSCTFCAQLLSHVESRILRHFLLHFPKFLVIDALLTVVFKVVLEMRSNAVCWNPMEAYHFTAANEVCEMITICSPVFCVCKHLRVCCNWLFLIAQDNNLYTFDMRKLDKAINVHMDFTSAGESLVILISFPLILCRIQLYCLNFLVIMIICSYGCGLLANGHRVRRGRIRSVDSDISRKWGTKQAWNMIAC